MRPLPFLLVLAWTAAGAAEPAAPPAKPNVLLIVSDDQGFGSAE